MTGELAQFADSEEAFDRALAIVGIATLVLIIGLLLLIYRSPVAALLPVVTVGLVASIAPGLIAWGRPDPRRHLRLDAAGRVAFLYELGFAVSVGILLSAIVMALFLVPGLTALIGHTAWWPGHGDEAGAVAAEPQEPAQVVG